MLCFYHKTDLDGICSGMIIERYYPGVKLYPIDYHQSFPWHLVGWEGEKATVFMVDFSLKIHEMVALKETCDLVWIDHHVTAVEPAIKSNFNPNGKRDIMKAGCVLTWEWCEEEFRKKRCAKLSPEKRLVPRGIRLLGEYDLGRVKDDPKVLQYQYGLKSFLYVEGAEIWRDIINDSLGKYQEILSSGIIATSYAREEFKRALRLYGFEAMVMGHPAICLNTGTNQGLLYNPLAFAEEIDLFVVYVNLPDGRWRLTVSTIKKHIHCGRLCEIFPGGGGHKEVGGCVCEKLPFEAVHELRSISF